MTPRYQIGTEEANGTVGSRAAQSDTYAGAVLEAKQYLRYPHIIDVWVRAVMPNGRLGDVIWAQRGRL